MAQRKTLLVVDDNDDLRGELAEQLELHDEFQVHQAATATDGVREAVERRPDLILLDVDLPDMDGREACRQMRIKGVTCPVIMLTAADTDDDTIRGLDAGANDYVTKPFKVAVLLARIRAQIRHRERRPSDVLATHGVQIDLAARTATLKEQPVALTAKEFKVLAVLMRRMGQFVSKDELEASLYDAAAEVESNTIEVAIYGLRRKLGAELIVTARGLGYMAPHQP